MRIMWELAGGEHHRRLDEGHTLIGRSRDCQVYYPHRSLSRRHAAFERTGERLLVRDLGSRTGVKVNGRRVEAAELEEGDRVTVGCLVLVVGGLPGRDDPLEGSGFQAEPESDVMVLADQPRAAPPSSGVAPPMRLRIERGAPVRAIPLDGRTRWLLGSGPDVDLTLPEAGVSRHHAELVRMGDGWTLRDLGSRNGTLVDGAQVVSRAMVGGEQLEVGSVLLRFEPDPPPSLLDSVVDRFRPRTRARQLQLVLAGVAVLLPVASWAGSSEAIAVAEEGFAPRMEDGLSALVAGRHRDAAEAFGSAGRAARGTADPTDDACAEAFRTVAVHWQGLDQGPLQFYWGKAADLIERAARQEGLSPAAAEWVEAQRRFVGLNQEAYEALGEGGRALAAIGATRDLTAQLSIAETGERAFERIAPESLLAGEAALQRRELRRRALTALEAEADLRAVAHRPEWRELLALIERGHHLAEDGPARDRLRARAELCEINIREEALLSRALELVTSSDAARRAEGVRLLQAVDPRARTAEEARRRLAGLEAESRLGEAIAAWGRGEEALARVRLEEVFQLGEGVPADVRARAGEARQRWLQVENGLSLARELAAQGMHAEAEGELRRVVLLEPDPRNRLRVEAEEALALLSRLRTDPSR